MVQTVRDEALDLLRRLGVSDAAFAPGGRPARSPITGEIIATLRETTPAEAAAAIGSAAKAFLDWRKCACAAPRRVRPPARRGIGASKADLGRLVTLEVGKVNSEGLGEVQEMIDICD